MSAASDPRDALLDFLCDLMEECLGAPTTPDGHPDPYARQKRRELNRLRQQCGFRGSSPAQIPVKIYETRVGGHVIGEYVVPVADSGGTDSG